MSKYSVISNVRKEFISSFLKKKERVDGRAFDEMRSADIQVNPVPHAEGSAIASLGKTQVLAGIKLDIVEPFPDEPTKGVLISNAELLPLASKYFEPGPPNEVSIEFARVVDRAVRHSEALDMEKLFVEDEKVIGVFMDLYVVDYDGNLFDAAVLAASAALKNCRLPKIEDGKFVRTESSGNLPIEEKNLPVSCTFSKIDGSILLDPGMDEEMASDAMMTLGFTDGHVVSMQKRGTGSFKKSEVLNMVDIAFSKHDGLKKVLEVSS
ncbi:MAG: exosome complex protein Rrp42 [Methanobacteriota archaeon]|nr:MAG: exosome complex protein Rrp42 [Euryarchaeota archaeon]